MNRVGAQCDAVRVTRRLRCAGVNFMVSVPTGTSTTPDCELCSVPREELTFEPKNPLVQTLSYVWILSVCDIGECVDKPNN